MLRDCGAREGDARAALGRGLRRCGVESREGFFTARIFFLEGAIQLGHCNLFEESAREVGFWAFYFALTLGPIGGRIWWLSLLVISLYTKISVKKIFALTENKPNAPNTILEIKIQIIIIMVYMIPIHTT